MAGHDLRPAGAGGRHRRASTCRTTRRPTSTATARASTSTPTASIPARRRPPADARLHRLRGGAHPPPGRDRAAAPGRPVRLMGRARAATTTPRPTPASSRSATARTASSSTGGGRAARTRTTALRAVDRRRLVADLAGAGQQPQRGGLRAAGRAQREERASGHAVLGRVRVAPPKPDRTVGHDADTGGKSDSSPAAGAVARPRPVRPARRPRDRQLPGAGFPRRRKRSTLCPRQSLRALTSAVS